MNKMFSFFKTRVNKDPQPDDITEGAKAQDFEIPATEHLEMNKDQVVRDSRGTTDTPEIPEHVFVEYAKPKKQHMDAEETETAIDDLQMLYDYLGKNLETKGYEDALVNPDTAYMEENVRGIRNELHLRISKVRSYYNVRIRTIDFHLETRKRSGMVETVEELATEKAVAEDEVNTVLMIEEHARNGNGLTENLFLSYKKGFKNGFAAITYNTVLNKKRL